MAELNQAQGYNVTSPPRTLGSQFLDGQQSARLVLHKARDKQFSMEQTGLPDLHTLNGVCWPGSEDAADLF